MDLEDLEMYQRAMALGESIWDEVQGWPRFAQDTVGKQVVRSADSIAANISESQGRYGFKDRCRFCYYSRGSLQETLTWITKARKRGLISDERARSISQDILTIRRLLNGYISYLNRKSKS